jgi:hypothetical protein
MGIAPGENCQLAVKRFQEFRANRQLGIDNRQSASAMCESVGGSGLLR